MLSNFFFLNNSLKDIIKFENVINKILKQKIVPKKLLKLQIHFVNIKYFYSLNKF